MQSEHPVSIAIVEDDDRTREHLCAAVAAEPGLRLAASFDRAQPALEWLMEHRADVLLADLGLPDGSGIDVIRACHARYPDCDILVITMFGDDKNVLSSIEAGAAGYLLKDADQLDVARLIRDLRAGGSPISPLIARKVLQRVRPERQPAAPSGNHAESPNQIELTRREAATLDLIARGYTYSETAQLMSVSVGTVQTHVKSIYGKLAVHSRAEAVFEAHRRGLLSASLFKS
jgi:DNA-binding NarL/FixJ family response regulator